MLTDKANSRDLRRSVLALFIVGFYYNSYRYPFMINTTSTQNYADTPPILQLGKYALVGLVLTYAVAKLLLVQRRVVIHRPWFALFYLYLAVVPISYGLLMSDFGLMETGAFFLIPIVLHLFGGAQISCSKLAKCLAWTLAIGILVDFAQMALFLFCGRLPGLAWEGSPIIRFGSFLDDPNGFGILIAFFAGFALVYYRAFWRIVVLALLFVCLLLTQSFTALFAVVFSVACYGTLAMLRRPICVMKAVGLASALAAAVVLLLWNWQDALILAYRDFMYLKSVSIHGHMTSFSQLSLSKPYDWFGLFPRGLVGESGYINLLLNFGVIYLAIYLVVGMSAVWDNFRIWNRAGVSREAGAVAAGAFCFLLAAYSGIANLPLEQEYPINILVGLLVGLASSGVLQTSDTVAAASGRAARSVN